MKHAFNSKKMKRSRQSLGSRFLRLGLDWSKANLIICFLIAFLGVGYLFQVNSLATKGYKIKELEQKVTDLKLEKSDLELEALSLQSVGSVKDKVGDLKMVSLGKEDYLADKPVALAR
ncbi:MAG: hypothetical protein WCX71_04085 [Candidatus Buchananbacteria bacterium]